MTPPVIHTSRTLLSLPNNSDAEILFRYYLDNRTHLQPWEPTQTGSFFTLESFETKIKERCLHFANGTAINFVATDIARTEVIAVCNFTNVVRGAFQACNLGYSIAKKYQDQGYMTEVLTAALDYVYNEAMLHRVMANYLPHNKRSAKLLETLGFKREGIAKSYLKIAGKWQDHILTAKLNPNH